jgi:hypothetical protein
LHQYAEEAMPRSVSRLALVAAVAALAGPALADDWNFGTDLRGAYAVDPKDWTEAGDATDTLGFETGLRYWYSLGAQSVGSSAGATSASDAAHIGELYLRVDDYQTGTFIKGIAGYSAVISGVYDSLQGSGTLADGHVGYIGADFAWNAFGSNDGAGAGPLVGYLFWQDAPDTGRFNFSTAKSADDIAYDSVTGQTFVPGDSTPNFINVHALRLGVQGRAKLGDFVDVSGEVAAVPYAKVGGTAGVDEVYFNRLVYDGPAQVPYSAADGNISFIRTSPTTLDGWGYGAMAEGWLGIHPTENLTLRLGGRAWYLQGTADTTYTAAQIGNPGQSDPEADTPVYDIDPIFSNGGYIETNNPFSLLRYGVMAELSYRF